MDCSDKAILPICLNWFKCPPDYPKPDDKIIVKLVGCKLGKYAYLVVREGEGLGGWFDEWAYFNEKETIK